MWVCCVHVQIEEVDVDRGSKPLAPVRIADCGLLA